MSIYDYRDRPAYGNFRTEPHYAKNRYILKWWNSTLDDLLATQISLWQWVWYWTITDSILKITPSAIIENWKKSDPLCSKYAWYNILMYFAAARAEELGLTRSIRHPQKKKCSLCNNDFIEDSLPMPLVAILGIERLDFCAPCLSETFFIGIGSDSVSKEGILKYLQNLANLLGRVPPQNFGVGMTDWSNMSTDQRLALLRILKDRPSVGRVKSVFGSWLNALIQADILEDGTRQTSRGIQSIAKDGHVCLSLGEKTIDDYLYALGVHHEREPRYPEGNYRGDFKTDTSFIEYFGLTGNPEYDAKTREKIRLCKNHKIKLIAIYPEDLANQKKLEEKLSILFQEKTNLT